MLTIYKYPVEIVGDFEVVLPSEGMFLSVQMQQGTPCMWWLVDEGAPSIARKFYIIGTGDPAQHIKWKTYLGTVQQGPLVWHLFTD